MCSAIKRVYVPGSVTATVDALAERAGAVQVGNGSHRGTQLGPINNRPQFDRVADWCARPGARGGVAAGGAAMDGPGYFFEPTILAGVTDGIRIVDEEQFGPALPVIPYRDRRRRDRRANATNFGLGGSVWSADPDRAGRSQHASSAGQVD